MEDNDKPRSGVVKFFINVLLITVLFYCFMVFVYVMYAPLGYINIKIDEN
jgi:hypothetical protein